MTSGIEWTEDTWNPIAGCTYVSRGCRGCYAAREAFGRLSSHPLYRGLAERGPDGFPRFTGEVRVAIGQSATDLHIPDRLDQPSRWRRPRMIFVNSMSDLFHPNVPADVGAEIITEMARNPRHIFQVLTKRPKRMAQIVGLIEPLPNVWWGTSIESNEYAWRADHLRTLAAAGHTTWVSAEPIVGPLDQLNLEGLSWLVAGGESGRSAEPMLPAWPRDLRDRCAEAGVPFLFKQWGEWGPDAAGNMHFFGKHAAGRTLDGVVHDGYPARPDELPMAGAR